jgi:hypothetical protein
MLYPRTLTIENETGARTEIRCRVPSQIDLLEWSAVASDLPAHPGADGTAATQARWAVTYTRALLAWLPCCIHPEDFGRVATELPPAVVMDIGRTLLTSREVDPATAGKCVTSLA